MAEIDVGTPVEQEMRIQSGAHVPAEYAHWTVPQSLLFTGGFELTRTGNRVTGGRWRPLGPTERVNPLRFMPIRGGNDTLRGFYMVKNGNNWDKVNVPDVALRVRAPQPVNNPEIADGRVSLVQWQGKSYLQAGQRDRSNNSDHRVGIKVGFRVNDGGCAGEIAAVSFINSSRLAFSREDTNSVIYRRSTQNQFVLDNHETYQGSMLYQNRTSTLGNIHWFYDTPAMELKDNDRGVAVEEQFHTTLVFKSSRHQNACWVPLQTVVWSWKGYAKRGNDNQWVLDQNRSHIRHDTPVVPNNLTAFGWNRHIQDNAYETMGHRPDPVE